MRGSPRYCQGRRSACCWSAGSWAMSVMPSRTFRGRTQGGVTRFDLQGQHVVVASRLRRNSRPTGASGRLRVVYL